MTDEQLVAFFRDPEAALDVVNAALDESHHQAPAGTTSSMIAAARTSPEDIAHDLAMLAAWLSVQLAAERRVELHRPIQDMHDRLIPPRPRTDPPNGGTAPRPPGGMFDL